MSLSPLSTNAACQLNIFRHDCDALGVNCAQVRVLKQSNEVGFSSLLKSKDSRRLEAKIRLEVLGYFANKTLKRSLANKKICGLLVFTNLTESDSTRAVTVRLFDASSGRGGLPSSLSRMEDEKRGRVLEPKSSAFLRSVTIPVTLQTTALDLPRATWIPLGISKVSYSYLCGKL